MMADPRFIEDEHAKLRDSINNRGIPKEKPMSITLTGTEMTQTEIEQLIKDHREGLPPRPSVMTRILAELLRYRVYFDICEANRLAAQSQMKSLKIKEVTTCESDGA